MQKDTNKPHMRDIRERHTTGFDGHVAISIYYLFNFLLQ